MIHDVIETVAGVAVAYTAPPPGRSHRQPPTTGGGGTGGSGVTIVVNGSTGGPNRQSFQTDVNQLTLNASSFHVQQRGSVDLCVDDPTDAPSVGISYPGGNTAMALIQLVGGKQTYIDHADRNRFDWRHLHVDYYH